MAIVREYDRQVGAPSADMGRRAGYEDMGIAQGLHDLGQGISQGIDAMTKYEEQREISDAQIKLAEADAEWDAKTRTDRENATPGVSTAIQTKAGMSDYFKKMQQNYKTKAAQQYIALHGTKMTNTAVNQAAAFDVDLSVRDRGAKREQIADGYSKQVYADPNKFEEVKNRLMIDSEAGIGNYAKSGDARYDVAMDAERQKTINKLAYSAGIGSIDRNPVVRGTLAGIAPSGSSDLIASVMKREGGYVQNDNKKGPTNHGINGASNGLNEEQVRSLTKEQAAAIYKRDYWDKYGVGDLSPSVQAVVFDGVVNHRSDFAKQLVSAAQQGASPQELGQMRLDEYSRLAESNPKNKEYLKSWTARVNETISQVAAVKEAIPPNDIQGAPWWSDLNVEQRHNLIKQAEQKNRKEQALAENALKSRVEDQRAAYEATGKVPPNPVDPSSFTNLADRQKYVGELNAMRLVETVADEPYSKQLAAINAAKPVFDAGQEPGVYAVEQHKYETAVKLIESLNKKRNADPMLAAHQRRFSSENPIVPMDKYDADSVIQSTKIRLPQAEAVEGAYKTGKFRPLMNSEAANLKATYESMDMNGRSAYLDQLRDGLSDKEFKSVVGQVWENNAAILGAGAFLKQPDDVRVNGLSGSEIAKTILIGESIASRGVKGTGMADESATKGNLVGSRTRAFDMIANHMKGVIVNQEAAEKINEMVYAHYVGSVVQKNGANATTDIKETGTADNKSMLQNSIKTILGSTIQHNGTKVLRPWGMDESQFKDAVNQQIMANYPLMEDAGLQMLGGTKYQLTRGNMVVAGAVIDVSAKPDINVGREARGMDRTKVTTPPLSEQLKTTWSREKYDQNIYADVGKFNTSTSERSPAFPTYGETMPSVGGGLDRAKGKLKEEGGFYGNRPDGTKKGSGWLGELQLSDGGVATEYTVQSEAIKKDGKRIDFPTLVPTLTKEEVSLMINDIIPNRKEIPEEIWQKAIEHAKMRLKQGKSVFKG